MLWSTVASKRARVAGLLLTAAFVAACGSSATTAPSAGASAAASPAASAAASTAASSEAPASEAPASQAPSVAPAGSPSTGDAAGALANLSSYKFKIKMQSSGITGGMAALGADITMEGTALLKPTKAADVTMTMGATGSSTKFHIIEYNGKTWLDMGTGFIASQDSNSSSMVDSLSPQTLASSFMGASQGMKTVGDETKNGIATTHVMADAAALGAGSASMNSAFGLDSGTWSVDAWVAKEGGYLVSAVVKATGKSSGADATFSMSIDLSDLDNPSNTVTPPA